MLNKSQRPEPAGNDAHSSIGKNAHSSIGTRKESSLHKALKYRYSGSGGATETYTGTYVCDACTVEGELIEVQTGSFGPLKEKVKKLVKTGKVKIVHPIIAGKHIELYSEDGRLRHRRKSPRKGSPWDLFNALIYAPELPLQKNLSIELAIIDTVEKRIDDGRGSWRRKGVSITDHILAAWHGSMILKTSRDYKQFIPFNKDDCFSVCDFGEKAGINVTLARKALYVLAKMGLVERTGKKGNAFLYKRRQN